MNYRHAFHAGNFADLLKHAVLLEILRCLTGLSRPLTVIDTHAGAGIYDLEGEAARRTGEAAAGIRRLMASDDAPGAFDSLKGAVRRANRAGGLRCYPGSPALIAEVLRPRDAYIACELHPEDYAALKNVLPRHLGTGALLSDGWRVARERAPAAPAGLFVLVDPPFESGGDHASAVTLAASLQARNPSAVMAIWIPIKDLATFDNFLSELEDAVPGAPVLVAEVRLRPLTDPLRLNGCAMAVVNPPDGLEAFCAHLADWIARAAGEAGALGRTSTIGKIA